MRNRNLFIAVLALLFSTSIAYTQSPLPKGQTQLNLGVGLSSWGVPFYFGLDHAVHRDVSVGGEVSFRNYDDDLDGNRYRHGIVGIAANTNYHFNTVFNMRSNWDLYAGLNLGFYIWNSPDRYEGSKTSGLGLGAQVGTRYYLSDTFGFNLEIGTGTRFSDAKFGVSFRL